MNNERPKRKLANKMLSAEERKRYVLPFESLGWRKKKAFTELRVIKRIKRATVRRLEREIAKEKGVEVKYSIA